MKLVARITWSFPGYDELSCAHAGWKRTRGEWMWHFYVSDIIPINYAVRHNHYDCVCYLHDIGADIHIHYYRNIKCASYRGYYKLLRYLHMHNTHTPMKWYGDALMLHASMNGHYEIVRYLVENGTCVRGNKGDLALQYASVWGHYELTRYLVENGVDNHDEPLRLAILHERHDIVEYLRHQQK